MSLIAMAFIWTGSQIPVYIFGRLVASFASAVANSHAGAIPPYIYADIGGTDRFVHPSRSCLKLSLTQPRSWIWFVLANLLALAGICPFVGSLSDLLGRRYVALVGSLLVILGMIVSSTAKVMNTFIGK